MKNVKINHTSVLTILAAALALVLAGCDFNSGASEDPVDSAAMKGSEVATTCMGCHNIPTYTNAYPTYNVPKLWGQQPAYILEAFKGYENKKRAHATMTAQVSTLSDEQRKNVAEFFSAHGKTLADVKMTLDEAKAAFTSYGYLSLLDASAEEEAAAREDATLVANFPNQLKDSLKTVGLELNDAELKAFADEVLVSTRAIDADKDIVAWRSAQRAQAAAWSAYKQAKTDKEVAAAKAKIANAPKKPELTGGQVYAAAGCAACHGPAGLAQLGGSANQDKPILAGQYKSFLIHALNQYRDDPLLPTDGTRRNISMTNSANMLSTSEIEKVSVYLQNAESNLAAEAQ